MSILGVLYKVDGFPQLSTINSKNSGENLSSNERKSTNVNARPGNYFAVPVGVNLAPVQIEKPQRSVECCQEQCLSRINNAQKVALKRKYNSINCQEEQMNYLKSLRCFVLSPEKNKLETTDESKDQDSKFLVPAEGRYPSSLVCKNAFRFIYGISLATLNRTRIKDNDKSKIHCNDTAKDKTEKTAKQSVCDNCGRTFSTVYAMRHHRDKLCNLQRLPAKKCQFQGCQLKFYHTTRLAAHMRDAHKANIEPERLLTFSSETEFLSWKHSEETRTFSLFTQNSGTRRRVDAKVTQYACQRDGSDRAHVRKDQPARKTERKRAKGRVKSNITCVAYMKVEIFNSGSVKVFYSPSHSHPLKLEDTVNHPITPKVKEAIEKKLEEGFAPKEILCKLKSQSTTHNISSDKIYVELGGRLVNQRVVSALARGKYPSAQHLHANDDKAVILLLEQLKNQEQSPLLMITPHVKRSSPLFIVLQHPHQTEALITRLLLKDKSCVLYIADLEETNNWDVAVYSALITDDSVGAIPVGFCLSNQQDSRNVVNFLKAMKTKMPHLWNNITNIYVSPNLATQVREALPILKMSSVVMLSARHTLADMQSLLNRTLSPGGIRLQLSQCLPRMVSARTKAQFLEELKTLRALVATNPISMSFLKEFEMLYLSRPGEWALCVRDSSLHASDFGESFNNFLLEFHQSRYPLKRLDDLINTLLKVGSELFCEKYQQDCIKETIRRQEEYQSHMEVESDILVLDTSLPGQWEVKKRNSDVSVLVVATGSIASSPIPGPLDYHCSCSDMIPLCCHVLNVHAKQHGTVSDILVPEPSNMLCSESEKLEESPNSQEIILIDVFSCDIISKETTTDNDTCNIKFVPDIQNLAFSKSDLYLDGRDDNICYEVVIETTE